jgi:hypothetical protein
MAASQRSRFCDLRATLGDCVGIDKLSGVPLLKTVDC